MNHFLKFLKIVVGVPFFAVVGLLAILIFYVISLFSTNKKHQEREAAKEDLNRRKAAYKEKASHQDNVKQIKDALAEYNASLTWNDIEPRPTAPNDQEKRKKEKAVLKRRKRNKIAKKSRQQNRK
jgi:flagellar biosynthesis component FlhA